MFKVNVVDGGELAANALIYKQPPPSLTQYLTTNMANVLERVGSISTGFVENVKAMYNKYNSADVINASKLLLHKVGMHFDNWAIYRVPYEHFHNANLIMQQYIMVQPSIYKLHSTNRCYGFQDTYIDPEPDTPLEERTRYQQVMDGVLQFDKNEEGYLKFYSNEEDELHIVDKVSILDTWDDLGKMIARGLDPTDPDYESL